MKIFLIIIALLNFLLSGFVLYRLRQPTTLSMWATKVFISALAPVLLVVGLLCMLAGIILRSPLAIVLAGTGTLIYLFYMIRSTRAPDASTNFEQAFGKQWTDGILPEIKRKFLPGRYVFRLPTVADPVFRQNIVFYTIPETNRQLLCDIWQPPKDVRQSRLAFIYIHGSAWTVLDKDYGSRPLFRHLANQGHVIMDIAHRLYPETDMMGMLDDTKHAIAWLKSNASTYGIDSDGIVIGGGSSGGHLALLAAYTNRNLQCTPTDLLHVDLSLRGVISFYGQSDLKATYYHTCQHMATHSALAQKKPGESAGMPSWVQKSMGADFHRLGFDKDVQPGMLAPMLRGTPEEKPDIYELFSPITYVSKDCPTTLILHGLHDILAPVHAIEQLYTRLTEYGVPVIMHLIPQTDHAFDLILPKISPSAHNAFYDVERFLAIMAGKQRVENRERAERMVYTS